MNLKYVEDWLLFLSGSIDLDGNKNVGRSPLNNFKRPFNLASYDLKFVESVLSSTLPLTQNQVHTTMKILSVYKRKFAKLGIDPVRYLSDNGLPTRQPVRVANTTQFIKLVNGEISIRFPYHMKYVNVMHSARHKKCCGKWDYDNSTTTWTIGFNEGNIHILAHINGFVEHFGDNVDDALLQLFHKSRKLTSEKTVLPTMTYVDGAMVFVNVPPSASENMIKLGWSADNSDLLYWGMIAKKHGIQLSLDFMNACPFSHIFSALPTIRPKFDVTRKYIAELTVARPDLTFLFMPNGKMSDTVRSMTKIYSDMGGPVPKNILYLDPKTKIEKLCPDGSVSESDVVPRLDTRKAILVSDIHIGYNIPAVRYAPILLNEICVKL